MIGKGTAGFFYQSEILTCLGSGFSLLSGNDKPLISTDSLETVW